MSPCYFDTDECDHTLWRCLCCGEQYCQHHFHTTKWGTNVICVACEYNETDFIRDFGYSRIEKVFGVCASPEGEEHQ